MEYTLFVVIAPLAAAVSIGVVIYAWQYRGSPGASALTWHMIAISGWLTLSTLGLLVQTEVATFLCNRLSYWFSFSVPVTGFAFSLQYTGRRHWLAFPLFMVFCIIPAIAASLAQFPITEDLVWGDYTFVQSGGLLAQQITVHGPWLWVYAVYAYALTAVSVSLIVIAYFRSFRIYRRQATWVLIGAIMPLFANIIYIFHLVPGLYWDYSPISLALGGVFFAFGIFRLRLFDLKPIARNYLVDGMTDGMIVLDEQKRVVDINPAAQAIISVVGDASIGQPAEKALSFWNDLAEYIHDGQSKQIEIALARKDRQKCFDTRISPLLGQGGRYVGYLITLHDITQQKQIEEERERLIDELDAFAHTVAHDLRNPLNAIHSLVGMLSESFETPLNDKQELYLRVIHRSVAKTFSIIQDLMLLSGVRTTATLEVGPVDMAKVVTDAYQRLEPMIQEYDAEIKISEAWPSARGYAPWLEEVWVNYLSNALKYGGQPPTIELGADEQPKGFVRFWVRDNGPGILPDDQAKLFTPFTRLSQVELEGHGLGLSIVRRIVERLGGQVGMESEMGKGSLFFFTLPADERVLKTP
ncbi:MAG: PAS domain-containing protein [Anaerolineae bacterium]|nr:PAS domain-containing protein [Anaerolineae bacterium]